MTSKSILTLRAILCGWLSASALVSAEVMPRGFNRWLSVPIQPVPSVLPSPTPSPSPLVKIKLKPSPSPSASPFRYNFVVGTNNPVPRFSVPQPIFQLQATPGGNLAAGVQAQILKGYPGKTAMGAFGLGISLHYYSEEDFQGWWGKLGLSIYGVRAKLLQGSSVRNFVFKAPSVQLGFGYRFKFKNGLNIGVSVDALYMTRWNLVPGSDFSGALPLFTLDVGYSFSF